MLERVDLQELKRKNTNGQSENYLCIFSPAYLECVSTLGNL